MCKSSIQKAKGTCFEILYNTHPELNSTCSLSTGRRTFSSWRRANILHLRKLRMCMQSVNLSHNALCMVRKQKLLAKSGSHLFSHLSNLIYIGDSLNSCLVAVVCVDPDVLKDWAASENIKVIVSKTSLFTMIF